MATHSSVLAWRIPGMGSLVGCRLWGCTELDTTEVTQQQQQQDRFQFWLLIFSLFSGAWKESLERCYIPPCSRLFKASLSYSPTKVTLLVGPYRIQTQGWEHSVQVPHYYRLLINCEDRKFKTKGHGFMRCQKESEGGLVRKCPWRGLAQDHLLLVYRLCVASCKGAHSRGSQRFARPDTLPTNVSEELRS